MYVVPSINVVFRRVISTDLSTVTYTARYSRNFSSVPNVLLIAAMIEKEA
jgi:hypothetical protein